MRTYIEFSGAASQDGTLRGAVVRYDDTGEQTDFLGGQQKYKVLPTAVNFDSHIILNLQHDKDKPIAGTNSHYLSLNKADDGVFLKLDYPDTLYGRQAREGVETGVYTGLSAEYNQIKSSKASDGLITLESVNLTGVGLVTRPAFRQSTLFDDSLWTPMQFVDFPVANQFNFRDIAKGKIKYGEIGITSMARKQAVVFEKGSLEIPESVAITLGASYDNILGSTGNGFLEVRSVEDGIEWALNRVVDTTAGRDFNNLVRAELNNYLRVGFQTRDSSMSRIDIDGVEYNLETVKDALLCELRVGSAPGGNGEVEATPRRRRRRRRR